MSLPSISNFCTKNNNIGLSPVCSFDGNIHYILKFDDSFIDICPNGRIIKIGNNEEMYFRQFFRKYLKNKNLFVLPYSNTRKARLLITNDLQIGCKINEDLIFNDDHFDYKKDCRSVNLHYNKTIVKVNKNFLYEKNNYHFVLAYFAHATFHKNPNINWQIFNCASTIDDLEQISCNNHCEKPEIENKPCNHKEHYDCRSKKDCSECDNKSCKNKSCHKNACDGKVKRKKCKKYYHHNKCNHHKRYHNKHDRYDDYYYDYERNRSDYIFGFIISFFVIISLGFVFIKYKNTKSV